VITPLTAAQAAPTMEASRARATSKEPFLLVGSGPGIAGWGRRTFHRQRSGYSVPRAQFVLGRIWGIPCGTSCEHLPPTLGLNRAQGHRESCARAWDLSWGSTGKRRIRLRVLPRRDRCKSRLLRVPLEKADGAGPLKPDFGLSGGSCRSGQSLLSPLRRQLTATGACGLLGLFFHR
jgi:hypothetical protein